MATGVQRCSGTCRGWELNSSGTGEVLQVHKIMIPVLPITVLWVKISGRGWLLHLPFLHGIEYYHSTAFSWRAQDDPVHPSGSLAGTDDPLGSVGTADQHLHEAQGRCLKRPSSVRGLVSPSIRSHAASLSPRGHSHNPTRLKGTEVPHPAGRDVMSLASRRRAARVSVPPLPLPGR